MSQIREQFEARFPVPPGVAWSDEHQNYGWVKKSAFQKTITYRALWTGWQASRESLAVDLPRDVDQFADDDPGRRAFSLTQTLLIANAEKPSKPLA